MLWENYLTSVGKAVSKESRDWLLSNIKVGLGKHQGVQVAFLFWCQREAVGNMDAPRTHLTVTSTHLPLDSCLCQAVHACLRLGAFTSAEAVVGRCLQR